MKILRKSVIGIGIVLIILTSTALLTNPSKEDFETFIPSQESILLKNGNQIVKSENVSRINNSFIYSKWQVDFLIWKDGYNSEPDKIRRISTIYTGYFGNFHAVSYEDSQYKWQH